MQKGNGGGHNHGKHGRLQKTREEIAADMGGKRQPGSGSRWGPRGILSPEFMIEAKVTDKASFSVSLKDLDLSNSKRMEGKSGVCRRLPRYGCCPDAQG